jgi:alginate O-acetyltransferase complex protein AlgI
VGLTLFAFGPFEKVFLADGRVQYVAPVYERAVLGVSIALLPAWVAAVGFAFQVYFDFWAIPTWR